MAFGQNVKAGSTNSIVIGEGYSEDQKLNNSTPNSLAIGFNSTQATLFVSGATGGASETGKVGIGTSFPMEKLDVVGNVKIDGSGYIIDALGVGTTRPEEQLEVAGNAKIIGSGFVLDHLGVGTTRPSEKLDVAGNAKINGSGHIANNLSVGGNSPDFITLNGNDMYIHGQLEQNGSGGASFHHIAIGNISPSGLQEGTLVVDQKVGVNNSNPKANLQINNDYNSISFGKIRTGDLEWSFGYIGFNATRDDNGVWHNKGVSSGGANGGLVMYTTNNGGFRIASIESDDTGNDRTFSDSEIKEKVLFRLQSNGKIMAKEIEVLADLWPDYVFEEGYTLKSLDEVEDYIAKHKHLPGVPSAKEIEQDGLNLGDMDAMLLEKIEELTLYVIELEKEISALKNTNSKSLTK
jgi:hypothetical protein